jgi:dynein heavy chain
MKKDTTERIFTGLAQTGFWGCFDEFNRISIEVLSVVASQVKNILDALRAGKKQFKYMSQEFEIRLVKTCGMFITMNPGYAGRSELPDNLKASFRWCAMVVPNLDKICENMLLCEGFNKATSIASKFITLYTLSNDLLSKQKHYDWGLRGIKSLLRQAGGLKRIELNQGKPEEYIIKKALFDFNKAKIVPVDIPIFNRLLDDLFKEQDGKTIKEDDVNKEINEQIEQATEKIVKFTKDQTFTTKVRQLLEIMTVRHCIFILGNPGTGKTSVWMTLFHTLKDIQGMESANDKLSPKAISKDELFGYNDRNKVWHFGVLSSIMQKMCKNEPPYTEKMKNKWIIIDGDIDPDWIESLNTVMDDNKVLTLNNGDRFPLDEAMRLLFEISNLRNATLATVTRGGVLYITDQDIGTQPFFDKWLYTHYGRREHELIRVTIQKVKSDSFERLRNDIRESKDKDKFIATVTEISLLQNVCTIFKNLVGADKADNWMTESSLDDDQKKKIIEGIYYFSFIWGVGGAFTNRKEMHSMVNSLMDKKLRLPDKGDCFDYYFDIKTANWADWENLKPKEYEFSKTELYSEIIIPNTEVIRLNRIIEINLLEDRAVLFVGDAGTGKTSIVNNFLKKIPTFKKIVGTSELTFKCYTINFNSFTDSLALQTIIESNISAKYSNRYGPINGKMVFFLDDLNMPELDKYNTQSHIELLRQVIDYKECYDRKELENKKILEDLLFVGCQNPKAGSFVIDTRLQRHFTLIATTEPKQEIIDEIYTTILNNHFKEFRFKGGENYQDLSKYIIAASFDLLEKFRKKEKTFFPTALKFHYQWNLREISRVVNGLLRTNTTFHKDSDTICRLWLHECNRIFRDRLLVSDLPLYETASLASFEKLECYKGSKEDIKPDLLIYIPFDESIEEENVLIQSKSMDHLKEYIANQLEEYNNRGFNIMPLVLFDDAIMHVCRIARIICNPSSHALLVGVGGSGKQSLARLACFIKSTEIAKLKFTGSDYNSEKLIEDMKECMKLSCLTLMEKQYAILLNDNHIISEEFMIYINNFLSSGWVDKFYETDADKELDVSKLKTQSISAEFMLRTEHDINKMFKYLIFRIKNSIHMILCMSPVGEKLKIRVRKFPGILSCTNIDWFHEWPVEALQKVSRKKIEEIEELKDDPLLIDKLAILTSEFHTNVGKFNELFRIQERRFNYITPKSFLELISFFKTLVQDKSGQLTYQLGRLTSGLKILSSTAEKISLMKVEIEEQTIKVNFQKEISNRDLADVEREQDKINSEKVKVEDATVIAQKDYAEATEAQASAEEELKEAMPIKISAKANAENIQVPQLNEFIRNPKPNAKYLDIFRLIYYIFYPEHKGKEPDMNVMKQGYLNWDAVTIKTKLLEKLDGNVEWLTNDFRVKTKKYQEDPVYKDEKAMRGIYSPVWDVVAFFHNLIKYKDAILKVDPLIQASAEAKEKAEKSTNNKNELEAKLELLIEEKNKVEQKYLKSKDEKERVEAEQKKLTDKYDMAMKFTSLLSGNEKRWKEDVIKLNEMKSKLGGDCILASAFVSYVGVFNNVFRENIVNKFKELIALKDIAITSGLDIVNLLVKEEEILKYKSENLPDDPFSIANAAIIKRCQRWPLIIDPQTQAMKWIRGMSGKKVIVQYGQKFWGKHIGEGIEAGDITVIEDCAQEIDALLLPLLGKETYRREGSLYIKLGSDEYVYNPNTTVYLVTKITNPHYQPEIAAQCTLINFIVTEKGLEDQLLALVVNTEQPELEDKIKKAFADINNFQRELIQKEDDVLRNLNSADENTILDNIELVTSLEQTKKSAQEIEEKSIITQTTINEIKINREIYRKVGEEGAMLFFLISKLFIIQLMYQFSLESFHHFFLKAISETQKFENVHERVRALRENIRISIFLWITAGMFERDKQLFLTMIALRLLQKKALVGEELQNITQKHIDFLLRNPKKNDCPPKDHALDWMDDNMWKSLNYLSDLPYFEEFASRMEKEQAQKFKDWYNEHQPEEVPLPLNWRVYKASSYQKLLVLACMRPDRISVAINHFVKEALPQGYRFLEARSFTDTLYQAFLDSSPEIPIFFILSPGSNPITEIIKLKKKLEHGKKNIKFEELAMGEGQDVFANQFLDLFNAEGGWLFLQNVHLMPNWLPKLQDKLKDLAREKGNDDFRLFLSAEPVKEIPVGIREKCLKLTNEPPSGLKENMKIAFNVLKNENPNIEDDRKRANIAFGLCYYHAVMIERKKFSSLGWNRNYPFTLDDLRNSDMVVGKYLENNTGKIPWDDLRYIVGEIMYGGHIVDDWDRILNMAYLEYLFDDKIHDELDLVPYPTNFAGTKYSLRTPANNVNFPFNKWGEYIEQYIKTESPAMFGLHPNAELDFRTQQASTLFQNLIDLEPKDGGGSGEETEQTKAEKIILECEEIMVIAGDGLFRMDEFDNLNEERTPFNNVFIQELEQMKMLCEVVKKNSFDLREALEGRLTMTDNLERIRMNIYTLRIPSDWLNNGFATNRKLPSWKKSLKLRIDQYNFFFNEKIPPKITFINRLFNPLSYLTAIKQDYAQRKKAELDKLTLFTEPTNHILFGNKVTSINDKNLGENATLVYGLHLQGARLEDESKMMEDSRPKEDYYVLPVINCVIRESTTAKMEDNKNYYVCPVYKTTNRDTTFVCKAYFKTKNYPAKWTIAGVAVILDVEKGDETNNFLAK